MVAVKGRTRRIISACLLLPGVAAICVQAVRLHLRKAELVSQGQLIVHEIEILRHSAKHLPASLDELPLTFDARKSWIYFLTSDGNGYILSAPTGMFRESLEFRGDRESPFGAGWFLNVDDDEKPLRR